MSSQLYFLELHKVLLYLHFKIQMDDKEDGKTSHKSAAEPELLEDAKTSHKTSDADQTEQPKVTINDPLLFYFIAKHFTILNSF